ncbi:hypothetical protein [Ideonella livida]|uniref:Uncharacterized protein n=1 Tax=Ideonella livida TaxID=2707176 RepID=A0A7C9PFU5_9BURK|nr:hypothetical protein [Ideonella livida]NDY90853.1 hypothetical protein [Ideonella livida]
MDAQAAARQHPSRQAREALWIRRGRVTTAFGNALGESIASQSQPELNVPPPVSADEKAAILGLFADGPRAASTGQVLSPVFGRTFAEDAAVRKALSDPDGFMQRGRDGAPLFAGPAVFSPDDVMRRWEVTGTKPVYDFGDPLEFGGGDGDLLAGAGGVRLMRTGGGSTRTPFAMSANRRSAEVLDTLSNADALGLIPEAYRDIKQIAPMLAEAERMNALEKLQGALRARLGPRVMPTPQDLGAVRGIYGDGSQRFDTGDLIDRYSDALRKVGLAQQGVVELDYRNFEIKAIGNQRMTPEQYMDQIEKRYQKAFASAVANGERLFDAGKLPYPVDRPKQLQVGLFADDVARRARVSYNQVLGVLEGPGQVISLNRWAYDMTGSGQYVRPDVFIDLGPGRRSWIDGKTSLMDAQTMTHQFENFYRYTGSTAGKVATPYGVVPIHLPVAPKVKLGR